MSQVRELEIHLSPWVRFARGFAGTAPGAIALGLLGAALTCGGVWVLAPAESFAHEVFFASPAFTVTQTFLFYLGLSLLLSKLGALQHERAVLGAPLHLVLGTGKTEGSIDRKDAAAALGRVGDLRASLRQSVIVNRIEQSLRRLHITGSTGELGTILSELSSLDEQRFESGHTMVRFLLAVIPIVGFIGTVLGISLAIGGFPEMLRGSEGLEALQAPIANVTRQLGVAFNTTLMALVQAGLLMFFQSLVQRQEEEFLSRVDEFGITEILNRVRMESEGVQFKLAMEREMQDLRLVMAEQNEELLLSFQEMIGALGERRS